jgi:hypothetical protein
MSKESRALRLRNKSKTLRTNAMNADIAGKSGKATRLENRAQNKLNRANKLSPPSTYKHGGHLNQYD